MKRRSLACFLTILLTMSLWGMESFNARIYRQDWEETAPLFFLSNERESNGEKEILIHRYSTPDGRIFAEEKVEFVSPDDFIHSTSFYEIGEFSRLESKGEQMEISFRRDGEEKRETLELRDDLLFGPTQQQFIHDNYDALVRGERLHFSLPAPEFSTTAGFRLKAVTGTNYDKPGHRVLEMRSDNFFINLLIKSVYYVIDDERKLIREIHGPSLLRVKEQEKWKTISVDIFFSYN